MSDASSITWEEIEPFGGEPSPKTFHGRRFMTPRYDAVSESDMFAQAYGFVLAHYYAFQPHGIMVANGVQTVTDLTPCWTLEAAQEAAEKWLREKL